MTYRSDLEALAARHGALATAADEATRARDDAAQLLADAQARARLPVLDSIRVATPCSADWNAMPGTDRVRTCGACQKQVFHLSQLTRAEAEALVIEHNGDLCVRYYQRADGTILLADCAIGKSQQRGRRVIAAGAAALLAGGGALGFHLTRGDDPGAAAMDSLEKSAASYHVPIMGGIGPAAPPPHEPVYATQGGISLPLPKR